MIRVAINGFGRIGRSFLRAYLLDKKAQSKYQIAAINIGPATKDWVAHLFKYDSFMGTWPHSVAYENGHLHVGTYKIPLLTTLDPADLVWSELGIDWVVESSGKFTDRENANKHIQAGAKKVLVTAFATAPDVTIVLGVNESMYNASEHTIVSLASCTANSLYPIVKVLHDSFDLQSIILNTMHSYTNRQVLMDVESVNLRRSRGAAVNIIPTTLQCPQRMSEVYPKYTGNISGQSTRVPVGKISFLDVAFTTDTVLHKNDINHAFRQASNGDLKSILATSVEQLVSTDYTNTPYSVVVDELLTVAVSPLYKVYAWYDNESGYSHRIKDFLTKYA